MRKTFCTVSAIGVTWLGASLGAGATTLPPLIQVSQVEAGGYHTCALIQAGGAFCWGFNVLGQAGDGTVTAGPRLLPTAVSGLGSGVQSLNSGAYHNCAVMTNGELRCWGHNGSGQLGDGTTTLRPTPVLIGGLGGPVRSVAAGGGNNGGNDHTCALTVAGGVKCWGSNNFGQLGDGTTTNRLLPVDVSGLTSGVQALAVGEHHACALSASGGVKCWGWNGHGQLGDGTQVNRLVPIDVVGLSSGVQSLALGSLHSCAVTTTGAAKCWGENLTGALGDGSAVNRLTPVDVSGLSSGVQMLGAGYRISCSLSTAGAVRCWGANDVGQTGDGTIGSNRLTAVNVVGLSSGVSSISVHFDHSCALLNDRSVMCWGQGNHGQHGDNTTLNRSSPVVVRANDASRRVAPLTPAANNASVAPQSDAGGRYVVFQSRASNLLGAGMDSNGSADIFRVDTTNGTTVRVSVNDNESQISGDALEPAVSANGELVAFVAADAAVSKVWGESKAAALRRRKGAGWGVFMRNLLTGTTQRIGQALDNGVGTRPQLSPNGNAIVFTGSNTDPTLGAVGQDNVFIVPLQAMGDARVPGQLSCVSCKSRSVMGAAVADADGASRNATVSADGRYIAYETLAKNSLDAIASPCPGQTAEIMLRDLLTGSTQRISPPASLPAANCGSSGSTSPSIDYSGLNLVFASDQALKPGDANLLPDVYAYTAGNASYARQSEPTSGSDGNGASSQPVISGDGRTVAFVSAATNLDASFTDSNDKADIHARRRNGGAGPERLSKSTSGVEANDEANRPALNYSATVLLFDSPASNLVSDDGNAQTDVFQRVLPSNAERVFGAGFE